MDRTFSACACCRCGSGLVQNMDGSWSCPTPTAPLPWPHVKLSDPPNPAEDRAWSKFLANYRRHAIRIPADAVEPEMRDMTTRPR